MRPQCYFIIYYKTDSLNAQQLVTFNWYLPYRLRSQLSSLSFESWGFCYWARRLRATVTYPAVLLPSLAFCELFHSKSIACSLMNLERSSVTIF